MNGLECLANSYGSEITCINEELNIAQSPLRVYRPRLESPFAHDAYMQELTQLRKGLKECRSAW
ncbi:MAG: hypothetical protein WKF77_16340 [Planctomycetaceae bacterium]